MFNLHYNVNRPWICPEQSAVILFIFLHEIKAAREKKLTGEYKRTMAWRKRARTG